MRIGPKTPPPTPKPATQATQAARPSAPAAPSDAELASQIYARMMNINTNNYMLNRPPNTQGMRRVPIDQNQVAFLDKKGNFYITGTRQPAVWAGPMELKPGGTAPANRPANSDAALRTQLQQRLGQFNISSYLTQGFPPDTMGLRRVVIDDRLKTGGAKQEAFVDQEKGQFYMHVTPNPSLGSHSYWAGPIPMK
jgi:hypothetical protein